jgi:hypothetical protein
MHVCVCMKRLQPQYPHTYIHTCIHTYTYTHTYIHTGEDQSETRWERIPKQYRKAEIRLGRLGIEGFDFHKYNQTGFSGLENMIPNSWVNPWIHTMFFFKPLRTRVMNGLSSKDVSLSDELGFLFHMLAIARGECCQVCVYVCMYVHMYVCMHSCICVCLYVCMHASMHVCI